MELLPLPPLHHGAILALGLLFLSFLLFLLYKTVWHARRKKRLPKDIYALSLALQNLAPKDRDVQKYLAKLRPYKYRPDGKKPPKELLQEGERLYMRLLQQKRGKILDIMKKIALWRKFAKEAI